MLACPSVVARPQSCNAARIKAGRNGIPVSAIVIHLLSGIGLEAFESSMSTPLPNFSSGHLNPLSVHFVVTDTASIQYAEIYNTTYGLDYFKNPTWPPLNHLFPLDDVNAPFIHIAVKSECQSIIGLVTLVCCIIQELGMNIPVIAASDLQSDRPHYIFDPTFTTQVSNCLASGGNIPDPPSWIDLWHRIEALEACCFSNTVQINLLKTRVNTLENTVTAQGTRITTLEALVASLQVVVAQIPSILEMITIIQGQIQNILDNCCPEIPESACFDYQLLNGQEQAITPNQPVHLNLPTRVLDAEPPLVITGPLWRADLSQDCVWSLDGIVRFKLNEWCTNSKVDIVLVACGQRTVVATKTITSSTVQLVQLAFNGYLQPGGCNNVYLEVSINDQSAQLVSFAEFKGCCT